MVLVSSGKESLSACVPQTTKCIKHQLRTKKKVKNLQHNIGNTDSSTSVSLEREDVQGKGRTFIKLDYITNLFI